MIKLFFVPLVFTAVLAFVHSEGKPEGQLQGPAGLKEETLVIDEPLLVKGLEVKDFDRRRCIQLKEGAGRGLAETWLFEASGRYDISLFYVDESSEVSELIIGINDRPAGGIKFDEANKKGGVSFSFKKKTLPGINIQQWSKITLQFSGGGAERCRIEKMVLTRVGDFEGSFENLKRPLTLEVLQTAADRQLGREMLPLFVNSRIDRLMDERVAALHKLKTPEEWKAQQTKTREALESFFGKFPERTPLHATITGRIDRENYTIEKLYFQSQPGYFVTANLYLPKGRKKPLPGVLFTCGHSVNGKNNLLYHSACLGMVLKGYVVLAIDPMGQGERLEYFDTATKEASVDGAVNQHYYLGRPCFLINRTFSGLRTWDCIRALDYLVSRPEVDTAKIAAVGNSGGGQMALLITAVDKRVKVCAAGHPGGQMEKNYLPGQNLIDRQIFSLIAPRPVRIIVGERSGEEAPHRKKIEDIQLFNQGLGYPEDRAQLVLVDGVHDLKLPKRIAVYEWLNKWFDKEQEGSTEAVLQPEDEKKLWVTQSGSAQVSLGGETGQSLNAKGLKKIYRPAKDAVELKKRIADRIGWDKNPKQGEINAHSIETIRYGELSVEKLTYQSETGILVPSLLIQPKNLSPEAPVYIYASDGGKPHSYQDTLTPFALAKKGFVVLAIDVRGVGETSPTASLPEPVKYSSCTALQWIHDRPAIESPGFGRTMLGMRSFDVARGIDFIGSRKDLRGRKVMVYGEGLGGLWAMLVAIYDARVKGVITEGTLGSYKELVNNKYYAVSSAYFWGAPGVLFDFDIPDLARLAAPKSQAWIDPINGLGETLGKKEAEALIGVNRNIQIILSKNHSATDKLSAF